MIKESNFDQVKVVYADQIADLERKARIKELNFILWHDSEPGNADFSGTEVVDIQRIQDRIKDLEKEK